MISCVQGALFNRSHHPTNSSIIISVYRIQQHSPFVPLNDKILKLPFPGYPFPIFTTQLLPIFDVHPHSCSMSSYMTSNWSNSLFIICSVWIWWPSSVINVVIWFCNEKSFTASTYALASNPHFWLNKLCIHCLTSTPVTFAFWMSSLHSLPCTVNSNPFPSVIMTCLPSTNWCMTSFAFFIQVTYSPTL